MTHFEQITMTPEDLAKWFCHRVCEDRDITFDKICSGSFKEMILFSCGNEHCGEFISIPCDCDNLNNGIRMTAIYKWLMRNVEDDYIDNFEKMLQS